MPQKKHKKRQRQSPINHNSKYFSRIENRIMQIKHRKGLSSLSSKDSQTLFQSTGTLSFSNKKIKHLLSEKNEAKTSTQRDISTVIFQEGRPNRQYYGHETSIYLTNKCQSSSNLKFSQRIAKTKHLKRGQLFGKGLKTYRMLQVSHSQQLAEYSRLSSKKEMHRLRHIHQCELRLQMQKIIGISQKILSRKK